jgi:pyruvate dehydrogenase E2 component (dihydrolipoamide acetyltransferase)
MISEVVMPQMGADMTEGTIVQWRKKEGDQVERGEIIAEIETDKANVEIEAFESGVFRKVIVEEGATVDVGTTIAIIGAPEDDISAYDGSTPAKTPAKAEASAPPPEAAKEAPPAKAPAVAPQTTEAEAAPPAPPMPTRADGRVRVSPVARKLADEHSIDLSTLTGSGPDGRIVRRDVEAAAKGSPTAPAKQDAAAPAPAATTTVTMSKMRQTIARRMAQSKREAPHYYITVDVDMAAAEDVRHQLNDELRRKPHVSTNDFIVKASAVALARHPVFNSLFVGDQIQQHGAINVCLAVALDDGLIAPAILDCGNKSLIDITRASLDLIERAKSGALKADEYTAGTFTVTSLQPIDVETLIPIIQPPQTAILGVGNVREAPVVRDGRVLAGKLMKITLAADHRVTDGVQGARFLQELRRLLERPAALLL